MCFDLEAKKIVARLLTFVVNILLFAGEWKGPTSHAALLSLAAVHVSAAAAICARNLPWGVLRSAWFSSQRALASHSCASGLCFVVVCVKVVPPWEGGCG